MQSKGLSRVFSNTTVQKHQFNITVIQVYALTSNAEETEVEQFYEDLQDLLELTPQKDVLFIKIDVSASFSKKRRRMLAYSGEDEATAASKDSENLGD